MTLKTDSKKAKNLGVLELIAIALGGMVGGGIFTILGLSVAMIGPYTPLAILLGGLIAALAAYSYIKLGVYYQDEGASYSFFKRTFPQSEFAASLIGWWVIFGYISTIALYAYTFSFYALSGFLIAESEWMRKIIAAAVILFFALINIWSVKGMGKIEDVMVYSKLVILMVISFVLINNSNTTIPSLVSENPSANWLSIFMVASLTFVAYEGFQLVINAVNEMENPDKNIPKAIYSSIGLAIVIYVVISLGAILSIPFVDIIANQEFALAAGADKTLGHWGTDLVVLGALLATCSAISGTLFGASRQMAVISSEGFFPKVLAYRKGGIPVVSIFSMAGFAILLVFIGNLKVILEFGSVTFLLVSLLTAFANYKIRDKTQSSLVIVLIAMVGLFFGMLLILLFEWQEQPEQLIFIGGLYGVLTLGAWLFAKK
ncbi:amino acid permease [Oceaniserpentilla sp. 4NH20-0058]|uniref:APC family permease n=1 Tax=Oceaniserpentilla sp. 4NH20-0058 TaxID=3127660 RepID=UPI0031090AA1